VLDFPGAPYGTEWTATEPSIKSALLRLSAETVIPPACTTGNMGRETRARGSPEACNHPGNPYYFGVCDGRSRLGRRCQPQVLSPSAGRARRAQLCRDQPWKTRCAAHPRRQARGCGGKREGDAAGTPGKATGHPSRTMDKG